MKAELIIFGAGKTAVDTYEWAVFAGYDPLFFVDNDSAKWGKVISGIEVKSPEVLKEYDCTVVSRDLYRNEIAKQLNDMMYAGNIIGLKQLKREAVCSGNARINLPLPHCNSETGFVFDAYFPEMNWGGIESYSCIAVEGLEKLGIRTHMLCGMNEKFDRYVGGCIHFPIENELTMIKKMAEEIVTMLPCIFITHGSIALYAAQLIKSLFPDKMQIVFITHGDDVGTYEMIYFWSDYVDKIVCISEKIQKCFLEQYIIKKEKLIYRPNPISIPEELDKLDRWINHGKALKVGFAARLLKEAKRVHLLPQIINECSKRKIYVEFNIAGEGEYREEIITYVSEQHLESMVHVVGWIAPTEMVYFWKEQDIYLNISDSEGMCLTMLEAMACGAVPVVTDVSGVSDMIEDGKNGFIIPVNDWMASVDKIEILEKDRKLLQKAGSYNMDLIKEKCNVSDYAEWMTSTFHF